MKGRQQSPICGAAVGHIYRRWTPMFYADEARLSGIVIQIVEPSHNADCNPARDARRLISTFSGPKKAAPERVKKQR
jgi:hypothetical protein